MRVPQQLACRRANCGQEAILSCGGGESGTGDSGCYWWLPKQEHTIRGTTPVLRFVFVDYCCDSPADVPRVTQHNVVGGVCPPTGFVTSYMECSKRSANSGILFRDESNRKRTFLPVTWSEGGVLTFHPHYHEHEIEVLVHPVHAGSTAGSLHHVVKGARLD